MPDKALPTLDHCLHWLDIAELLAELNLTEIPLIAQVEKYTQRE
jgi:hypothetical protein